MNVPSGYTALDLIGFTDKGAYNSATSYVKNDLVSYNGEKWRCKLDDTVNHTPEEGTYWTIFIDAPSALDDLADVTISSVANGNILEYDSATSKWKNSTGLSDVKQALSNEVVTRSELGAHNLLFYDMDKIKNNFSNTGSWNGNTYTLNDVHYTFNSDGTISVSTESAGASASSQLNLMFFYDTNGNARQENKFLGKTITMTGCPSGGADTSYYLRYVNALGSANATDFGSGVTFTVGEYLSGKAQVIVIVVKSNTIITTPIVFKPMIRLATDSDPTYQPYAMTNRELTDVAKQIVGTYAELQLSESISVTADGTKTFRQLWNELILAWNAMLDSNVGTVFRPKGFDLAGITIPTFDRTIYHKYSSTSKQTLYFTGVYITSNGFSINEAYLNTTASSCRMKKCTNGTTEDISETAPTSGSVYTIYFDSYKQIS